MAVQFLSFLIFFLFTFQINGMEKPNETPFQNTTFHPYIESSTDESNSGTLILNANEESTLFNCMNKTVFYLKDPYLACGFRWVGRLTGLMAENAVVAMVAYVLFDLFHIAVNHHPYEMGLIDVFMVGSILFYLLLPATANMAQAGQEFYELCDPTPLVPESYRVVNHCSCLPLSLNFGSKFYAVSMATILTTTFHHIENSKVASYNWYFLTFFPSYALGVYYKNNSYFGYDRKIHKIYHGFENKSERRVRKQLKTSYKKCERSLQSLDKAQLKKIYYYLKNPEKSALDKSRELHRIANSVLPEADQGDEDELSRQTRMRHSSSYNWRDELSRHISNLAFYGSAISEYYFYLFGVSLFLENLGANPSLATNLGYGGAALLSVLSYIFEETSVREYYNSIFEYCFGSSHSASNPILRRGIGVTSFMVGTFLALSECYPAWAKTLSSESSASWFLLAFMIMRRHAPNALWLQGYNYSLSDWHSRDCKRDSCCKCCRRGKGKEEMINYISHVIHKMLYFLDHLNAEGIKMVWLHLQEDELEEDYYRV